MKLRLLLFAALCAAATASAAKTKPSPPPKTPLLPNLVPWGGFAADYFVNREPDGRRFLRFSAGVTNIGQGPLEFQGISKKASSTLPEFQVFYFPKSGSTSTLVGQCVYDADNLLWDVFHIAEYRLRDLNGNQVGTAQKASFCVADDYRLTPPVPGSPTMPRYRTCPHGSRLKKIKVGLSVGWSDVYAWPRAGQFVDVTNIPSGSYLLEMEANPEGTAQETTRDDNTLQVPVHF